MAAVRQQVLNWLYSVLTSEYRDVNRTYNDVAQALAQHSSLSPRTDVYTYETGVSALLLNLSGILPVVFRGTTYRFPISLWVPHAYPSEPPLVYVTPTEGMKIRPGQHVDPQGKVYHPYLVGWAATQEKSNILDFLAILQSVFATEPPVISRQQQTGPPQTQSQQVAPPVPPLPPGMGRTASVSRDRPPPPPPKHQDSSNQGPPARPPRQESGPPLPPLPPQAGYDSPGPGYQGRIPGAQSYAPQRNSSFSYSTPPSTPPHPQRQPSLANPPYNSSVPHTQFTNDPYRRNQYNQPPQQPSSNAPPNRDLRSPPAFPPSYSRQQPDPRQQPQWQQQPPQPYQHPQAQAYTQPQPKPPPPTDLLDAPLALAIPSATSAHLPAPPVPPNPEKDILLHNLGIALHAQRQHTHTQTAASLPGLEAQHKAMLTSLSSMQSEIAALESLGGLLSANTNILHTALCDADAVIESSQHQTVPSVDELLVAPTVVANQLYELVCEERSLGDALFVLGRAVERGRITPAVFAKLTRSLGREWYLKKALVKKIGKGMGLAS